MTEVMLRGASSRWRVETIGRLFRERNEKVSDADFAPLSVTKSGIIPQLESAAKSDDGDNRKLVRAGDLVINSRSDRKGSSGLSKIDGSVSLISIVLEPISIDPYFAHHLIRSEAFQEEFYRWGHGIVADLWTTRFNDMKSIRVAVPNIDQQRAIAKFLDVEIEKIDRLIEKQEEFVATLEEKWQAEITKNVSNGFPLRVKNVAVFITSGPRGWSDLISDDGDYFIQSGDLNHEMGIEAESAKRVSTPYDAESARSMLREGDAVVCITGGNTGRVAHARRVPENSYINQHLAIIRPRVSAANGRYIAYSLKSTFGRSYFDACQYGLKEGLNLSDIANAPLRVPNLVEQRRIVSHLDDQQERFSVVASKARQMVTLLREHRSALITAAVTGQIDVPDKRSAPTSIPANDNRQAFRAAVGAEIVSRHGSSKTLGRVKLQKLLYLAEVHAGVHELGGVYAREAAGPLARDLLSDTERGMATASYFSTVAPLSPGEGYTYSRLGKAGAHRGQLESLLGLRQAELESLIDRLKDYDTRQVEAITTLYAVWNDALLDGETPDDDRIIRGVLEEWHPEKSGKFTTADLKTWLAWMRRNGLVPTGTGSRTRIDRLFV